MRHAPTTLARAQGRLLSLGAGLTLGLGLALWPAAGAAEKVPAKGGAQAKVVPGKQARPAKATTRPPSRAVAKLKAKAKAKAKKAEPPHLPFVEGDYERALADARARNVPLVVDVWAPW